jgi:hypothetical protein
MFGDGMPLGGVWVFGILLGDSLTKKLIFFGGPGSAFSAEHSV